MTDRVLRSPAVEAAQRTDRPSALDQPSDARARLATRYAFRRPEEVDHYLRRHPDLVPALLQAADVIPRYFGLDIPLLLEVFTDPEEDDPIPELFVLIQTALGSEEAMARLDQLGDDCWTMASPDGPGTLVIDIERA